MTIASIINGNCLIRWESDGTRTIESTSETGSTSEDIKLNYPLSIDIRVSTKCQFGLNPVTGKAICEFCHESARVDGEECDYDALKQVLWGVPTCELAIGANAVTASLIEFVKWAAQKYIVNLTINQGHCHRDLEQIKYLIGNDLIKGLGISYRPFAKTIPISLRNYPHAVLHVIAGIDDINEVLKQPMKKLLVLGEKSFGFNEGKVNLEKHTPWIQNVRKLMDTFEIVAFDNLAIEQLKIQRFVTDWETFHQGEYSMYINAVEKTFSPSSRSKEKSPYVSIRRYFSSISHL